MKFWLVNAKAKFLSNATRATYAQPRRHRKLWEAKLPPVQSPNLSKSYSAKHLPKFNVRTNWLQLRILLLVTYRNVHFKFTKLKLTFFLYFLSGLPHFSDSWCVSWVCCVPTFCVFCVRCVHALPWMKITLNVARLRILTVHKTFISYRSEVSDLERLPQNV